jgi:predicted phosphodiesterase
MRIAILSDIHSNQHALEAVLADAREKSPDTFYCLGDIVGYGAFPRKCLEIVRQTCEKVVFGNHDYAITYPGFAATFNTAAQKAIKYAQSALESSERDFIKTLQPHMVLDNFTIAHGSLRDFNEYVSDSEIAQASLNMLTNKVLFVGHTHVPGGYTQEPEPGEVSAIAFSVEGTIELSGNLKYLINVGSVGQPRDGVPKAAYAIYDTDAQKVDIIRVTYDNKAASKAVGKAFLPDTLAKRLLTGK